ncbi:MAG: 4Fe-4S binding protein [Candidatus Bipolaricaulia bacterium]
MTPSKHVIVDYNSCPASECYNSEGGEECPAKLACSPGVLIQEEQDDPPMLPSPRMCIGCGDCIRACTHEAIKLSTD